MPSRWPLRPPEKHRTHHFPGSSSNTELACDPGAGRRGTDSAVPLPSYPAPAGLVFLMLWGGSWHELPFRGFLEEGGSLCVLSGELAPVRSIFFTYKDLPPLP